MKVSDHPLPITVAVSAPATLLPGAAVNHAALRKLRLIMGGMLDLGIRPTLVESLHVGPTTWFRSTWQGTADLGDGRSVEVIRPFQLPNPRLTKTAQAVAAPALARRVAASHPARSTVGWIYNGYLFERRWATALARCGIPFVLELEDWPTARRSYPLNIKTRLDAWGFEDLVRQAAAVLCVNDDLLRRILPLNPRAVLFPPIIDPALERHAASRLAPFSGPTVKVGYCGSLDAEKGAGLLIELLDKMPQGMELHVAGAGPLADPLAAAFAKRPATGRFHGFLSESELVEFLCSMDILVNPHSDIAAMGNSVFPSKLFDYIASGAAVVTTTLPTIDGLCLDKITGFDGTVSGLTAALRTVVGEGAAAVDQELRREVSQRFGLAPMTSLIEGLLRMASATTLPKGCAIVRS